MAIYNFLILEITTITLCDFFQVFANMKITINIARVKYDQFCKKINYFKVHVIPLYGHLVTWMNTLKTYIQIEL